MKTTKKRLNTGAALALLAAVALPAAHAKAGALENLERERAIVIGTILDPALSPKQRQIRIATATPRLVDLERMALRDNKLTGRNTPVVRRAFQNYDLTFMASASAEHNLAIVDNWLGQLGITTQSLMAAEVGRR